MLKLIFLVSCLLLTQPVTGAQSCNTSIPESSPGSRFSINTDEVTDNLTGLIWQRCTVGQSGSDCTSGSATNYNWQQALNSAGATWRLPNLNELESIAEDTCIDPAINLDIFPNTIANRYWSASPAAVNSNNVWTVDFYEGIAHDQALKTHGGYVRLVRDGE